MGARACPLPFLWNGFLQSHGRKEMEKICLGKDEFFERKSREKLK